MTAPLATATNTQLATPTGTAAAATSTATPPAAPGTDFCDDLEGAAFGLCNAFCNAQSCHLNPDRPSCDVLRDNFEKQTGHSILPCEQALTMTPTSSDCDCDCDGDGNVSINDLIRSVLVTLGSLELSQCDGMRDSGTPTIQDLIRGVLDALEGCS
jgi:hypothetical protein